MTAEGGLLYPGRELDAVAFAVNYHEWILDEFAPYLGASVAEVGAGMGSVSRLLVRRGVPRLVAFEPSANMFPFLEAALRGEARARAVATSLAARPPGERFDSVAYVNVLEHIEDDRAELAAAREALAPGGHLLVFVPAMAWLMSDFDRQIGHHRRYTRGGLADLVRGAGFTVVKARWFDAAGVLPWYVHFVLLHGTMRRGGVALFDRLVVPVIRRVERLVPPPFGKNVLLVARKT